MLLAHRVFSFEKLVGVVAGTSMCLPKGGWEVIRKKQRIVDSMIEIFAFAAATTFIAVYLAKHRIVLLKKDR